MWRMPSLPAPKTYWRGAPVGFATSMTTSPGGSASYFHWVSERDTSRASDRHVLADLYEHQISLWCLESLSSSTDELSTGFRILKEAARVRPDSVIRSSQPFAQYIVRRRRSRRAGER